jgi:hypothetical protein
MRKPVVVNSGRPAPGADRHRRPGNGRGGDPGRTRWLPVRQPDETALSMYGFSGRATGFDLRLGRRKKKEPEPLLGAHLMSRGVRGGAVGAARGSEQNAHPPEASPRQRSGVGRPGQMDRIHDWHQPRVALPDRGRLSRPCPSADLTKGWWREKVDVRRPLMGRRDWAMCRHHATAAEADIHCQARTQGPIRSAAVAYRLSAQRCCPTVQP